jgi:hypothetical protein
MEHRALWDTGGNLAIYLRPLAREDSILQWQLAARRGPVEHLCCLRCNRELEPGHKSVGVFMFAQTVGIRPRQKSAARRICFCSPCSVSLAMGPSPEGALNVAAWQMIRDLVGSDPALNQAAWDTLRGIVGMLPGAAAQPVDEAAAASSAIH